MAPKSGEDLEPHTISVTKNLPVSDEKFTTVSDEIFSIVMKNLLQWRKIHHSHRSVLRAKLGLIKITHTKVKQDFQKTQHFLFFWGCENWISVAL